MYAALTYFGQGKLVCTSTTTADNGKTVTVTDGKKTWTGVMTNGTCVFTLPTKQKYTIKLLNGNVVEYETETIFGFGEYKEVEVGMDKKSWKGLKAIVNAGLETEMLAVGDQISATVAGEEQVFDIVHINYKHSVYGRNIILAKHTMLSSTMQFNTTKTNVGGYAASIIAKYLDDSYYNSLPSDMKSAITQMAFKANAGNGQYVLQNEEHKIWLPLEYNILGKCTYSWTGEVEQGGAEQFAYFATPANRIKTQGNTGSVYLWWSSSPRSGSVDAFSIISTVGEADFGYGMGTYGVCPFFMIAADAE